MSDQAVPSFIKTGEDALDQLSQGVFLKIEPNKPINLVFLTGVEPPAGMPKTGRNAILSFNQATVWVDKEDLPEGMQFSPSFVVTDDKYDPCRILGLEQRFKALALVMVEGETQERILPMGAMIWKQLVELERADGSIRGRVIRISRTGDKLATKYSVTGTKREFELEGEPELNLMDHIGVWDREKVTETLTKLGMWPPVGGDPKLNVEAAKSKKSAPKDPPKGPPSSGEETADPGASGDYAEV